MLKSTLPHCKNKASLCFSPFHESYHCVLCKCVCVKCKLASLRGNCVKESGSSPMKYFSQSIHLKKSQTLFYKAVFLQSIKQIICNSLSLIKIPELTKISELSIFLLMLLVVEFALLIPHILKCSCCIIFYKIESCHSLLERKVKYAIDPNFRLEQP